MELENWKKVEQIYDEALKIDEKLRLNFVQSKSMGDVGLLTQVMKMLEVDHSNNFMESFPGKINTANIDLSTIKQLGHFRIVKTIATGGMGRVYLGQSMTADVPIKVALKTIRVELINQELKNKFQNEKNILSQLKHKNIASLIDAGITENHVPYIATEWVNGLNIKDYCVKQNLSIKQRLKLFLQICDAMTFAHNKMIIHRDLKPDNILVNNQNQVKLLDFGIAKIIDENQDTKTQTQIFTPDYASPEQFNGDMCTAATDIYSLGVILFEVLTNSKRFDLSGLAITEKIKTIATPKQANLSDVNPQCPLPYALAQIKRPLYNIINKAMHVEPNRRYNSVSSLVLDIENYIDNRPVKAMKDSYYYKFKMLIVRNKISSIFIFFTLFSASLGTIVTIQQLNKKLVEELKSQQVTHFLIDSIQASDPDLTQGKNVSVIEFLQNAKIRIQDAKIDDQRLTSKLKSTIGMALFKVGEYKDAEKLLIQATVHDSNNIESHLALAYLYLEQKFFKLVSKEINNLKNRSFKLTQNDENQVKQIEAKLLLQQGKFEQAIKTINSTINLSDADNQESQSQLIQNKLILANILDEYDHVDESSKILKETLKLSEITHGKQSTQTTLILQQLARNLSNSSPVPWDEVFKLYEKSLANQMKIYGEFHPKIAKTLLDEGFAFRFVGELDKAQKNTDRARKIAIRNFGESHILTAHIDLLNSQLSFTNGALDQAIKQLKNVIKIYKMQYGDNNFNTNQAKTTLSAYLIKAQRGKEALEKLMPLYRYQKKQLGENHKATLYVVLNMVKAHNLLKNHETAIKKGTHALKIAKKHLGNQNILTIGIQIALAQSFINKKEPSNAILLCEELLEYKQIKQNKIYMKKVASLMLQAKNISVE